jgi:trimethylamine--corrinoid protein Co-methyltransferase
MKPVLKFLSEKEIQILHHSALTILSDIGMRLPSSEALSILKTAGATVADDDVVKIPPGLIDDVIEKAPKRNKVMLYGRDPKYDVAFTNHDPAIACMTMATHVIDPYSGERRPATNDDLAKLTWLADQLENIHVNGGLVTPQEVPGEFNDWYTWATCIKNSNKHITGGVMGAQCVRDAIRMASAVTGSKEKFLKRPFISGWVLTLPPLGINEHSLEALIELSRSNIPAIVSSGPILGTSSPITIAGTIAQAHAEILACLAVSQLARAGAPFIYTSFARGMDMKAGTVSMAGPEFGILKGAMAQMGHSLGLPVRMPGMLRDSKILDAQAGFETALVGLVTALNADLMDAMQLDSDLLVDYADLVFCNECMGALKRVSRELVVDENTIVPELIKEIGHGGTFLEHEHTFANFRRELWIPQLMEHRSWDNWENDGALDIRSVSLQKAIDVLKTKPESQLPADVEMEIDSIVEDAQQTGLH